jgi:chemotaxis protein MotA
MNKPGGHFRMDWSTLLGLPAGVGLILLGQALEGGSVGSILQLTAGLIVIGGTAGAVLVSFTLHDVRTALASLRTVFVDTYEPVEETIREIVRLATKARRFGIISLENELTDRTDLFLRKSLAHAVDGAKPQTLRDLMELEIINQEEHDEAPSRVFDAAGGYSPTMGILGAVLGLIQVMEHLNEPDLIGGGIAIAFVATVYGVGLANLVWLPIATKLKMRARRVAKRRELMMEGVLAIQEGLNPRLIEEKLRAFVARVELMPRGRKRVA